MKRIHRYYIQDVLSSLQEIEDFTKDMDFETFLKDKKTVNAVIRSLEVMGEAVKRVPDEIRNKYPEIPWKYIAGMRDKLIHEYHGVDLEKELLLHEDRCDGGHSVVLRTLPFGSLNRRIYGSLTLAQICSATTLQTSHIPETLSETFCSISRLI
ncbi:MAG: hypothetical protein KBONHNOK_00494 [Candidatus Methanoperedenaceae archaeon GB50]|nr:MAG: hypothetical protein KBONHNOK_00494 [Candidatus Methanoperedenaceae archaeon GB50]